MKILVKKSLAVAIFLSLIFVYKINAHAGEKDVPRVFVIVN
ncbi:hypothetical protein [Alkalicella caledoniensis]|nr:hypothetical protein [Alkalicella caledoniensis]